MLPDRAALFVDGRYTLQAREQVDGALFEVGSGERHRRRNVARGEPAGGRQLGYDPWLHTSADVEKLS